MLKIKKIIIILSVFVLLSTCFACNCNDSGEPCCILETAPKFETELTAEQLRQKVILRTEEGIKENETFYMMINDPYIFFEYNVYTVYSFLDTPEYFLVEMFWGEEKPWGYSNKNYRHYLGYFDNSGCMWYDFDMYKNMKIYEKNPSVWSEKELLGYKLYFGNNTIAYKNEQGDIVGWTKEQLVDNVLQPTIIDPSTYESLAIRTYYTLGREY